MRFFACNIGQVGLIASISIVAFLRPAGPAFLGNSIYHMRGAILRLTSGVPPPERAPLSGRKYFPTSATVEILIVPRSRCSGEPPVGSCSRNLLRRRPDTYAVHLRPAFQRSGEHLISGK